MEARTPFHEVATNFLKRLTGLKDFLVASPALQAGAQEGEVARFGYQWLLVAYWAFLESFYRDVLFHGAYLQAEHYRAFILKRTPEAHRRQEIANWNADHLGRHAGHACSLKENAKKLRQYSQHLFGVALFPNDEVDRLVTDLSKVRNLIVHQAGVPESSHAQGIRTPGVIVPTSRVGEQPSYRLSLDRQSVMNFLAAGGLAVVHLNQAVVVHPALRKRAS